jgi:hypothetical protein
MNHRRAALYLQIPAAYCRSFGGLRWAQYGDAIEFLDGPDAGRTFAFAAEVGHFLEGLVAPGGPCPAFGTALHLLYMLGLGDRATASQRGALFRHDRLAGPFRELGSPLRNAGALCAWLARDVPGVPEPPPLSDILELLNGGHWIPQMVLTHPMLGAMDYAEQPAATPIELNSRVCARLGELPDEAIGHWLEFGRGPIVGADRLPVPLPPRGSADPLAQVEERPRLAGMTRLVSRLEGALSLPPRRLEPDGPQTDGYWDLTTRGAPEQILPIQFALEDEELLRRFAERELLYFHRERPSRRTSQELVLVLDQGVRTWGDVRLVLAGATMALARQAARRELAVRLATTGSDDEPVDPSTLDAESLGELLEASDFTPNPARTLARVLGGGSGTPRDVVLLTHPRSLTEPEVVEAARRPEARDATRIFAVSVEAGGQVELAELRRGRPVAISRCRVELGDASPPTHLTPRPAQGGSRGAWRGDVEPIPFPFRCGLLGPVLERGAVAHRSLDFDEAGGRFLVASGHGLLCAFRVDETDSEILPRPIVDGQVMTFVTSVIGVAGGFIVAGGRGENSVLAHYDFPSRTCSIHAIPELARGAEPISWSYYADLHSVVGRLADGDRPYLAVDLAASGEEAGRTTRATRAAERARSGTSPPPTPPAPPGTHASDPRVAPPPNVVTLDSNTGMLRINPSSGGPRSLTPMADGRPALVGARIVSIHRGGDILAAQVHGSPTANLWFVSMRRAALIGSFSSGQHELDPSWFALSRDGSRLARKHLYDRIEVRDVPGDRPPVLVTPREPFWIHFASLGRSCLLVREFDQVGPRRPQAQALIRWDGERLGVDHDDPVQAFYRAGGTVAESRSLRPGTLQPRCDPVRFVQFIEHRRLRILIDRYNHLAVLGRDDRLVAMFYLCGKEFAAWLPDGTRLGSSRLIGGEPSRAAAERIAAALRAAERGEGGAR